MTTDEVRVYCEEAEDYKVVKIVKIRLSGCKNFVGERGRSLYSVRSLTF